MRAGSAAVTALALVLACAVPAAQACPRSCNCYHANEVHCTFRSLRTVPHGLPAHAQRINLGFNSISRIPESSLAGLKRAELLLLHSNDLAQIPDGVFGDMRSLQVLKLSYNALQEISSSAFWGLTSLLRLHLDHNLLRHLHPRALLQLPSLRLLRLQGNRLHQLHPHSLCTLSLLNTYYYSTLRHLDLSNNSLVSVPEAAFSSAPLLESLALHANPWRCDCQMGWLLRWTLAHPGLMKCPGGPQCPVCDSPVYLQGQGMLQQTDLPCASPSISSSGGDSPSSGDPGEIKPVESFAEPLGDASLGLSDHQGNSVDLSCNVSHPAAHSPDIPSPDLALPYAASIPVALSLSLECPVERVSYESLWRILAYYSETAVRLEREIMLSKPPALAYRYRQTAETEGYYHTGVKASLKATPHWMLQPAVSLQLNRAQSSARKVRLVLTTRVSVRPDPIYRNTSSASLAVASSTSLHPWALIQSSRVTTAYGAPAGSRVELSCPLVSSAHFTLHWIIPDGSKLVYPYNSADGRVRVSVSGILIQRTESSDSGLYYCVARAGSDVDVLPIRLAVEESSVASTGEQVGASVAGLVGEAVTLPCNASGSPTPHVTWLLPDGNTVLQGNTAPGGTSVQSNGSLMLAQASLKDAGSYRCMAVNQYGAESLSMRLDIKSQAGPQFRSAFNRGPQSAAGRSTRIRALLLRDAVSEDGSGDDSEYTNPDVPILIHRRRPQYSAKRRFPNGHPRRRGQIGGGKPVGKGGAPLQNKPGRNRFDSRQRASATKQRIDPKKWADLLAKIRQRTAANTTSPPAEVEATSREPTGKETKPLMGGDDGNSSAGRKREEDRSDIDRVVGGRGINRDQQQGEVDTEGSAFEDVSLQEEGLQPVDGGIRTENQGHTEIRSNTRAQTETEGGTKQNKLSETQSSRDSENEADTQTQSIPDTEAPTAPITPKPISGSNEIEQQPNPGLSRIQNNRHRANPVLPPSQPESPWNSRRRIGQRRRPISRFRVRPKTPPRPIPEPSDPVWQTETLPTHSTHQAPSFFSTTTTSPTEVTEGMDSVRSYSVLSNSLEVDPPPPTASNSLSVSLSLSSSPSLSHSRPHSAPKQQEEEEAEWAEADKESSPTVTHTNTLTLSANLPARLAEPPQAPDTSPMEAVQTDVQTKGHMSSGKHRHETASQRIEVGEPFSTTFPSLVTSSPPPSHLLPSMTMTTATSAAATTTTAKIRQTLSSTVAPVEESTISAVPSVKNGAPNHSATSADTTTASATTTTITTAKTSTFHVSGSTSTRAVFFTPSSTAFVTSATKKSSVVTTASTTAYATAAAQTAVTTPTTANTSQTTTSPPTRESSRGRPSLGLVDPRERPSPGLVDPRERPSPGLIDSRERPSPGLVDSRERPNPGLVDPRERPSPGLVDSRERPSPGLVDSRERPSPGLVDTRERPSPGLVDSRERPNPGLVDPRERPSPGLVDPRERPSPGLVDPRERPRPGLVDPRERPSSGLVDPRERPSPGLVDPRERPSPGLVDTRERPSQALVDSRERPYPGLVDPRERPSPGLVDSGERPNPGLVDPRERPYPGLVDPKVPKVPIHVSPELDWKGTLVNSIPDSHSTRPIPPSARFLPASPVSSAGRQTPTPPLVPPRVPAVRSRPRIADPHIRGASVPAGGVARLDCETQGEPAPSVTWTRVSTGAVMSARSRDQRLEVLPNGTFVIRDVELQDRGTYICSAQSALGRDRMLTNLEVWSRPPSMKPANHREASVLQGGELSLDCAADAVPPALLSWVLPDRSVLTAASSPPAPRRRLTAHANGTLRVSAAGPQDGGVYRCVASNAAGAASVSVRVRVASLLPPALRQPGRELLALAPGAAVYAHCSAARGAPPPALRWRTPDGTQVRPSQFLRGGNLFVLPNGTLHIRRLGPADAGDYECAASNAVGVARRTVSVTLLGAQRGGEGWGVVAATTGPRSPPPRRPHLLLPVPVSRSSPPSSSVPPWGGSTGNSLLAMARPPPPPPLPPLLPPPSSDLRPPASPKPPPKNNNNSPLTPAAPPPPSDPLDVGQAKPSSSSSSSSFRELSGRNSAPERAGGSPPPLPSPVSPGDRSRASSGPPASPLSRARIVFSSPPAAALRYGADLQLHCSVSGYPAPTVVWRTPARKLVDQNLSFDRRLKVYPNGTLLVAAVTEEDAGDYLCIARNKAADDYRLLRVTVATEPAKIHPKQSANKMVTFGGPLKVDCLASGHPHPAVSWSLPDGTVVNRVLQGEERGARASRLTVFDNGTLLVPAVGLTEEGEYTCYAKNHGGQDTMKVKVKVIRNSAPTFAEEPGYDVIKVRSGGAATAVLRCRVKGEPAPSVTWFSPNNRVIPRSLGSGRFSERVVVAPDGTLEVRAAQAGDAGNYTCRARNTAGERSRVVRLEVEALKTPSGSNLNPGGGGGVRNTRPVEDSRQYGVPANRVTDGLASNSGANSGHPDARLSLGVSAPFDIEPADGDPEPPGRSGNSVSVDVGTVRDPGLAARLRDRGVHGAGVSGNDNIAIHQRNRGDVLFSSSPASVAGVSVSDGSAARSSDGSAARSSDGSAARSSDGSAARSSDGSAARSSDNEVASARLVNATHSGGVNVKTSDATSSSASHAERGGVIAGDNSLSRDLGHRTNTGQHGGSASDRGTSAVARAAVSVTSVTHRAGRGQSVMLPCTAPQQGSLAPPRLYWLLPRNGGILPAPYRGSRLTVHRNGSLELLDARISDAGTLVCVVQGERGEIRFQVDLSVVDPWTPREAETPSGRGPVLPALSHGSGGDPLVSPGSAPRSFNPAHPLPSPPEAARPRAAGATPPPPPPPTGGRFIPFPPRSEPVGDQRKPPAPATTAMSYRTAPLVTIINGENLRLSCSPARLQDSWVSWTLPRGEVLSRGGESGSGRFAVLQDGTLLVRQATVFDRGSYVCRFTERHGAGGASGETAVTVPVIVIAYPPRITRGPPPVTYTRPGVAVEMPCLSIATPRAEVTWETPDLARLRVTGQARIYGNRYLSAQGSLVVQNPSSRDTGFYRCTARNVIGADSKATYLHVV